MVLIMIGCTSNQPFRTSFEALDSTGADPTKAVIESTPEYKLGFVEFDDQGWFWDINQRLAVEQMIRTEAGIPQRSGATPAPTTAPHAAATPHGIILVAFVHGWKDNAAYDGDGVKAFRDILQQLSKAEQAQKDHSPRKVVGVYAGWRGLSATWEPFKELSFWERKTAAHKVGGYGAMTQLLTELEEIQKDSLDLLSAEAPRTELIIIGHSFGGAAVYSALSQIITERFVNSVARPPHKRKRLNPLGDQIILLNPAFEAVRHYDLAQMAQAIDAYPPDQRPVLSIFTSKGDWATHYAFPVGRFFSTLFDRNRSGEQKSANLDAVGWFKPFITHRLVFNPKASFSTTQPSAGNRIAPEQAFPDLSQLRKSHDNIRTQRSKWRPGHHPPETYNFDQSILEPIDGFKPGDPFLVVSVDKRIMKDHGDITNKVLINFIREYIQFCQAEPQDHSK